jgi:hypothetical protein
MTSLRLVLTCDQCAGLLEDYIAGDLDRARHASVRSHLDGCASCREALVEADPLQMFAALGSERRQAGQWDGFWDGVREEIGAPRRPARGTRPRRVAAWWAAAAAVVVMAGGYFIAPRLPSRPPTVQTPIAAVPADITLSPAGTPRPQTVEQVRTSDARPVQVFSMAYDPGAGEAPAAGEAPVTELVLIVDAGLEL